MMVNYRMWRHSSFSFSADSLFDARGVVMATRRGKHAPQTSARFCGRLLMARKIMSSAHNH
jgi:hypothetical protein